MESTLGAALGNVGVHTLWCGAAAACPHPPAGLLRGSVGSTPASHGHAPHACQEPHAPCTTPPALPHSIDNDLMTPSMKLKRPQLQARFQPQIDEMYREIKAALAAHG